MKNFLVYSFFVLFLALPLSTQAATLTFGGPSTSAVGNTFSVPVYLSTDASDPANAVSATISYQASLLNLVSISKARSIINLWPQEPTTGPSSGEFEGIILNPGWYGTNGTVVTLTFTTRAKGIATLSFTDASVLANDGNATPILTLSPSKSIVLEDAPVVPTPPAIQPKPRPKPQPTPHTPARPTPIATSTPVATTTPMATSTLVATTTPISSVETSAPQAPHVVLTNWWVDYLPFLLAVALLLIALGILMYHVVYNMPLFWIPGRQKRARVHEHFDELRDAVMEEMVALQRAQTKRQLTKEEEAFLKRFKQLLSKTERAIEKELK